MFTIGYITCKKCDDFQQIFANDNLDEDLFCYNCNTLLDNLNNQFI